MDISKIQQTGHFAETINLTKLFGIVPNSLVLATIGRDKTFDGVSLTISGEGRTLQMKHINREDSASIHLDDTIELKNVSAKNASPANSELRDRTDNILDFSKNKDIEKTEEMRNFSDRYLKQGTLEFSYREKISEINGGTLYRLGYHTVDFADLASRYAKVREEIETKYTGVELEEHLKALDKGYESYVDGHTKFAEDSVRWQIALYECRVMTYNSEVRSGRISGKIIEYDKKAFRAEVDAFAESVGKAIRHYAMLAKQYIVDGNEAPVTDEEKEEFNNYLKQSTSPDADVYSLDVLNGIYNKMENPKGMAELGLMFEELNSKDSAVNVKEILKKIFTEAIVSMRKG